MGLVRALTLALNIKVSFHNTCLYFQKASEILSLEFAPWRKAPVPISGILCQEVEAVEGEPRRVFPVLGDTLCPDFGPRLTEVPWGEHRIPGYPKDH